MTSTSHADLVAAAKDSAIVLRGDAGNCDPLIDRIRGARVVLIGEASHGTHEFYADRAAITRRLIDEHGFTAVAVEADWPDAYRVNNFVRGRGSDGNADEALGGFKRFPTWMWRNVDVVEFVEWLRARNARQSSQNGHAGFYGLDLYSLFTSMEAVVMYLDKVDPEAARRARARYGCFEHFAQNTQAYGYAAVAGMAESCEDKVVEQLLELRRRAADYASRDGRVAEDEYFYAEQNARLALNAERYYRAMFRGRASSWNLRDTHMTDTLDALIGHLDAPGKPAKVVVWAHNSHLGDARATEMGVHGEINVGQLVRERHPGESVSIGFTTFEGAVTAASEWDAPGERKRVRPGLAGGIEEILHRTGRPRFLLRFDDPRLSGFHVPLLERAIGVIYVPQTERQSHYFHAQVADQFDLLIHVDRTDALEPLEPSTEWTTATLEPPETYPSAL
jgi:erythromycin esterase-like protein